MEEDDDDKEEPPQNHWEPLLRKMLPAGAPLPDEDQLDFSILVEYQAPTHPRHLDHPIIHSSKFPKPHKFSQSNINYTSTPNNTLSFDATREPEFHDDDGNCSSASASVSVSPRETHKSSQSNNDYNPTSSNFWASVVDEDRSANVSSFDTSKEEEFNANDSSTSGATDLGKIQKRKNGVCNRCGKKKRLRDKEVCMVCDARYCRNCVLKAMGSMPQGRKCVGCIGLPIDESKRKKLGKNSRMLSKICSPLEVKQIMMAERDCSVNQLRPEQIVVNGVQLDKEDLVEVLGCHLPPRKLKPGRYWYDKDSGLWGKEGEKPDRVISSKLNVGGKLQENASNGNTHVFINGRQITKVELRVLKLAKVQCQRGTHFWVYDDGSYEEEGQNNIKGNIWGKAHTRLISSLFSLPVPHERSNGSKHDPNAFSSRSTRQNSEHERVQKLMLFGLEGSGTSTIFKQVKFLYGEKFTAEELQNLKLIIQSNMYKYLSVLLEGRERFEEEAIGDQKTSPFGDKESARGDLEHDESKQCVYSFNAKLKHFSDWLLDIMAMGDLGNYFPAATREYAPVVEEIWKDPAIRETYKRREELHSLPDVAKYFLDLAMEISSNEYEPPEKDILYAEGATPNNGLSYLHFSFHDHSPMSETHNENSDTQPPLTKYQLVRVCTKGLYDGCKWLDMFEDTRAVVFCVALSDYDQLYVHGNGVVENKMLAHRALFERIARHRCFVDVPFVLLLNKYDAFEEKLSRTPLTVCEWFGGFGPLKQQNSSSQSLANQAYYYVAVRFKELYRSVNGGKLFVWPTVARHRASVDEAVRYVREVVRWKEEEEGDGYGFNRGDSFGSESTG